LALGLLAVNEEWPPDHLALVLLLPQQTEAIVCAASVGYELSENSFTWSLILVSHDAEDPELMDLSFFANHQKAT
jgi:hypothetical protein